MTAKTAPTEPMTAKTAPTARRAQPADGSTPVNDVRLVGRLAAEPMRRELPSGDVLVSFRLVVTRTPAPRRRGGARTPTVDTLDCAAWRADVQRALGRLSAGDVVEAQGSLRRRFWRAGAAAVSRTEVEVVRLKRVAATT